MNIAIAIPIMLAILILKVILKLNLITLKSSTSGDVNPNSCPYPSHQSQLIFFESLTFLIPGIISFAIKDSFNTYKFLNKPVLSPPSIIFPIVWSVIYILISISIIKVKDKDDDNLKLYYVSLLLNALWTPIFFKFKLYFIALIDLIVLLYIVIEMTKKYKKYNKISSYLLVPYLVWLVFAFYLNLSILVLN